MVHKCERWAKKDKKKHKDKVIFLGRNFYMQPGVKIATTIATTSEENSLEKTASLAQPKSASSCYILAKQ